MRWRELGRKMEREDEKRQGCKEKRDEDIYIDRERGERRWRRRDKGVKREERRRDRERGRGVKKREGKER